MFPGMPGSCSGNGMSLLAETHKVEADPIVEDYVSDYESETHKVEAEPIAEIYDEVSETHEVVEPVLKASSAIVDSAPKESSEVGALVGLASGSFFVGLIFAVIVLRCKQRKTTEEVPDFNYTLEQDNDMRRI